jgi:hypothetical protein
MRWVGVLRVDISIVQARIGGRRVPHTRLAATPLSLNLFNEPCSMKLNSAAKEGLALVLVGGRYGRYHSLRFALRHLRNR